MKAIKEIVLIEPNQGYKKMLDNILSGKIGDYVTYIVFEGGIKVPFYRCLGASKIVPGKPRENLGHLLLNEAKSEGTSCTFLKGKYGDMSSRHEDGISVSDFIKKEEVWLKNTILKNIEKLGVGYHQTEAHRYDIQHTLPYICLRGSGGGGWSYIGKIDADILYVPKGAAGMFIGKGGTKIKEICSVAKKRLKVEEEV